MTAKSETVDVLSEYQANNYMPVPEAGCWLWTGALSSNGYGRVSSNHRQIGQAHRLFYALHKGPIPTGMFVCHKCDTRSCVNPDHLFLGTRIDNINDMVRKGRSTLGVKNPGSKLTEAEVIDIFMSRLKLRQIATQFGISVTQVDYIRNRRHWKHVTQNLERPHG